MERSGQLKKRDYIVPAIWTLLFIFNATAGNWILALWTGMLAFETFLRAFWQRQAEHWRDTALDLQHIEQMRKIRELSPHMGVISTQLERNRGK